MSEWRHNGSRHGKSCRDNVIVVAVMVSSVGLSWQVSSRAAIVNPTIESVLALVEFFSIVGVDSDSHQFRRAR